MFNSKKITNYRIDELENKIISLEKTIEILKEHIIDVEKKSTAITYNIENKFDELERKHEEAIDKQNIRIEELSKAITSTPKKKVSSNAKPNVVANS